MCDRIWQPAEQTLLMTTGQETVWQDDLLLLRWSIQKACGQGQDRLICMFMQLHEGWFINLRPCALTSHGPSDTPRIPASIAKFFGNAPSIFSPECQRTTMSLALQHLALLKDFLPDACLQKLAI